MVSQSFAFSRDEYGVVQSFALEFGRGRVMGREDRYSRPAAQPASRATTLPLFHNVREGVVASLRQLRAAFDPLQHSFVPVVGEIAAGNYQVTIAYRDYGSTGEQTDDMVAVAGDLDRGSYALHVRGTSMTHVGIDPGDIVVVKPQGWADDGDIVVAELTDSDDPDGYVTLKQFFKRRDHIFLKSATAANDPIRLYPQRGGEDSVVVQGRIVAVIKPGHD